MNLIEMGRDSDISVALVPSISGTVFVSVQVNGVDEIGNMELNDAWIYISQLMKDAKIKVPTKWLIQLADIVIKQNIVSKHYGTPKSEVELQHTLPGVENAE